MLYVLQFVRRSPDRLSDACIPAYTCVHVSPATGSCVLELRVLFLFPDDRSTQPAAQTTAEVGEHPRSISQCRGDGTCAVHVIVRHCPARAPYSLIPHISDATGLLDSCLNLPTDPGPPKTDFDLPRGSPQTEHGDECTGMMQEKAGTASRLAVTDSRACLSPSLCAQYRRSTSLCGTRVLGATRTSSLAAGEILTLMPPRKTGCGSRDSSARRVGTVTPLGEHAGTSWSSTVLSIYR